MDKKLKVIAIDGPSGSGKSSLAKKIAADLNITYVDTGAMYRALALYLDAKQVIFEEGPELQKALGNLRFQYNIGPQQLVVVNGENLTTDIRQHHVSDLASKLSKLPSVRKYLLQTQRDLAQEKFCIMEGRDIGTVVFPQAVVKIFLTATPEERAKRRWLELSKKDENPPSREQILADIKERDQRDSQRSEAPLVKAEDAILIDSTGLNLDQVQAKIMELAKKRAHEFNMKLV